MMEPLYYLIKVTACSAILFLFNFMALRNKAFHQWNRFYLLIAVILSLVIPAIQVTVYNYMNEEPNQAIQALQVVYDAGIYMEEITITGSAPASQDQWLVLSYLIVSIVLLILLIRSLYRIFSILKTHMVKVIQEVRFVNTAVPGTPFSFFNFIFWNRDIDLHSETGKRIFQHELVHVKEKHTLDKLFIQCALIFFWINPIFWLIRRELKYVHEFIADRKSVAEHGTEAFAAMILQSAYPQQFNSITNQFFQTSIKRRLAMLTKNQHPGWNYFIRLAAFVVIIITIAAFTLKPKEIRQFEDTDREFVVVIDAGHGVKPEGNRSGAASDNVYEDDIVLQIAQKIRELNSSPNIRIELAREGAKDVGLNQRVEFAKEKNADLFISLHLAASAGTSIENGAYVIIPNKNPGVLEESKMLGSAIVSELGKIIPVKPQLVTRTVGIYVLNFNSCPSILIECGYITNDKDRKFVSDPANQKMIAQKILNGIENFLDQLPSHFNEETGKIQPSKNKIELSATEFELRKGEISKGEARPLVFLNGEKLKVDGIESIRFRGHRATIYDKNDPEAIKLYGEEAKNGVIIFEGTVDVMDTVPKKKIPTRVDVEASVDKVQWRKFLEENLKTIIMKAAENGAPGGTHTVYVKFIVELDGSISNPSIVKDPGYDLGKSVLNIIEKSPKWNPALVGNKKVISYHVQPITFVIADDEEITRVQRMNYDDAITMKRLPIAEAQDVVQFVVVGEMQNGELIHYINKGADFNARTKEIIAETRADKVLTFAEIRINKNGRTLRRPALSYAIQ